MIIMKDRLLALLVFLGNGILGAWLGWSSENALQESGFAILLSLPGLLVIWFRGSLQDRELSFPRGVRAASPPGLLALVGWIYLLGIPLFYLYQLNNLP